VIDETLRPRKDAKRVLVRTSNIFLPSGPARPARTGPRQAVGPGRAKPLGVFPESSPARLRFLRGSLNFADTTALDHRHRPRRRTSAAATNYRNHPGRPLRPQGNLT